ncbi:hypothetical protein O181_016398 [Austropuccinia psidii MF-1]|uniref:Uncharacterized protein n=1 Tax=Austropuccinia psidii MF-1 TaxID=1389203 RepID=A0A9Q3C519_9BASI|nr:hypothetical protein [Austropuccinia psidii MF-1]
MCGKKGFRLILPPKVPTFLGATGRPTTIGLMWANHNAGKLQITTNAQLSNHSSNHQPIITTINFSKDKLTPDPKNLEIHRKEIDHKKLCDSLSLKLLTLSKLTQENHQQQLDKEVEIWTKVISRSIEEKGKWITTNKQRMKPWWNTTILNPLVQERNKARRDILKFQTIKTRTKYCQCKQTFKKKIWELKNSHWQKFLAEWGPEHMYQAYKFTKSQITGEITSLRHDGSLTTEMEEKAAILFQNTSVVEGGAYSIDTLTLPAQESPIPFPPVPPECHNHKD